MGKGYEVVLKYLASEATYQGLFAILKAFGVKVSDKLELAITKATIGVVELIGVIVEEVNTPKEKEE